MIFVLNKRKEDIVWMSFNNVEKTKRFGFILTKSKREKNCKYHFQ